MTPTPERTVWLFFTRPGQLPSGNAIMSAVAKNDIAAVIAWLDAGGDVNATDETGVTMLILASTGSDERIVETLLRRGAAVDLQDNNGWSALMHAVAWSRPANVGALLRAGAQTGLRSVNGPCGTDEHGDQTALELAKRLPFLLPDYRRSPNARLACGDATVRDLRLATCAGRVAGAAGSSAIAIAIAFVRGCVYRCGCRRVAVLRLRRPSRTDMVGWLVGFAIGFSFTQLF